MITNLELLALKPADHGRRLAMGHSLYGAVWVGADGVVTVRVSWRFKVAGKTREKRIGIWKGKDGMSLKAIFAERERLAVELRQEGDPIARRVVELAEQEKQRELERQRTQAEHEAALVKIEADRQQALLVQHQRLEQLATKRERKTVRQLFDKWRVTLQPIVRADGTRVGRKDGGKYVFEQFERHVFPDIGGLAVEDVRTGDLLTLLEKQLAAGKARTANVLLADLKQFLDYAVDHEIITVNPLARIKKKKVGGADVARKRHLSPEELALLCAAVPASGLSLRSQAAIWLVLATGVRAGEATGVVWADALPADPLRRKKRLAELEAVAEADNVKLGVVDMAQRTWHLYATKNQRNHTIHLSDFALAQFDKLLKLREVQTVGDGNALSPWVFPATDNSRPVCVKSLGKQLADRQRDAAERMKNRSTATTALMMPGGKWTAHDLRRTTGTLMAMLGVSADVINECLNHVTTDRMTKVYIQSRREADQVRAFDALGQYLESMGNLTVESH
jgi:integrase